MDKLKVRVFVLSEATPEPNLKPLPWTWLRTNLAAAKAVGVEIDFSRYAFSDEGVRVIREEGNHERENA